MATLEAAAREAQDTLYPTGYGATHVEFTEITVDSACTADALEAQAHKAAADKPIRAAFKSSTGGWTFVVQRGARKA